MRLKRSRLGLLIPRGIVQKPTHRCNFPGCDHVFYAGQERDRVAHAVMHATQDEETIHELMREPIDDILGPGDVEKQEYLERKHKQLLAQGLSPKEALDPDRY